MQEERKEWWIAFVYDDKPILVQSLMNEKQFYIFDFINPIVKKYGRGFNTWQRDLNKDDSLILEIEFKPGNCFEYLAKNILDRSFPSKFDLDLLSKDDRIILLNNDLTLFTPGLKPGNASLQEVIKTNRSKIDPELKKQGQWLSGVDKYKDSPRDPNCPFKWL